MIHCTQAFLCILLYLAVLRFISHVYDNGIAGIDKITPVIQQQTAPPSEAATSAEAEDPAASP